MPPGHQGAGGGMTVVLVASVARNGAIGRGNELVWDEPQDKRFFRRVTMGHPVVMGRKTWDSLPDRFRPLPGRRNIVVTRRPDWSAEGADVAHSLDEAIAMTAAASRICVIGGAQLFEQALKVADELVLTEIERDVEGDVFFPSWDRDVFEEVEREPHVDATGGGFSFVTYRRRAPTPPPAGA
jgi:dihydrofolate reductase